MKSFIRSFGILTLILITMVSCQKKEIEPPKAAKPVTEKPQTNVLIDHNSTVKVEYSLADLKIDFTRIAEILNLSKLTNDDFNYNQVFSSQNDNDPNRTLSVFYQNNTPDMNLSIEISEVDGKFVSYRIVKSTNKAVVYIDLKTMFVMIDDAVDSNG